MDVCRYEHMSKKYVYEDNVFSFEGCLSIEANGNYVSPWRISFNDADFYYTIKDARGHEAAGIRLCFTTDSRNILLIMDSPEKDMMLDLFVDGSNVKDILVDNNIAFIDGLSSNLKEIEIWLDQRYPFKLKSINIDQGSMIKMTILNKEKWVHYGSSISQCKLCGRPSQVWPSLVARKLNLDLINLGFDQQCKCDVMVARMIRDMPLDYITMSLGVNIYNGDLTKRTFPASVIGFVKIIREKHPTTPIVIISPIYAPLWEKVFGSSGYDIEDIRKILLNLTNIFKHNDDKNIFYVNGLSILDKKDKNLLIDNLHPGSDSQSLISHRFIENVFGVLSKGFKD